MTNMGEKGEGRNPPSGRASEGQGSGDLTLLLETMEAINRASELQTLLSESMDAVCEVMRCEAGSLMLRDEETDELYVALPKGPVSEQIRGRAIPPEEGIGGWVVRHRKPYLSNDPAASELFWGELSPDFETRSILCVPLLGPDGTAIGALQALNRRGGDFSEGDVPVFRALASHISRAILRTRQIESLTNEVRDLGLLLRESHHRIKNNLATIAALIDMEVPHVEDSAARRALHNTRSRLISITEMHDMVSRSGEFEQVDLGQYLQALTGKIATLLAAGDPKISLDLEIAPGAPVILSSEKAMYCGMILNELLANVYKHAFPREDGTGKSGAVVRIQMEADEEERITLTVTDNGAGLPEHFDAAAPDSPRSVGIWVIGVLRKKLGATLDYDGSNGTRVAISLPSHNVEKSKSPEVGGPSAL